MKQIFTYATILCFSTLIACNAKKKETEINAHAINENIVESITESSEEDDEDDFFKDWEKQPFKGTMSFGGSTDEYRLKEILSGNDPAPDTQLKFEDYKVFIHNYGVQEARINFNDLERDRKYFDYEDIEREVRGFNDYDIILKKGRDTISLYEHVFEDLSGKLLEIKPNNASDRFEITACTSMEIFEQYDYTNPKHRSNDEWWNEERIYWKSMSTYKNVADSADYYFRMPIISELFEGDFERSYKELNLRDTLVDRSGESSNVATLIYKEVPALFHVEYGIIRIKRFDREKNLLDTIYIKIEFSYGC